MKLTYFFLLLCLMFCVSCSDSKLVNVYLEDVAIFRKNSTKMYFMKNLLSQKILTSEYQYIAYLDNRSFALVIREEGRVKEYRFCYITPSGSAVVSPEIYKNIDFGEIIVATTKEGKSVLYDSFSGEKLNPPPSYVAVGKTFVDNAYFWFCDSTVILQCDSAYFDLQSTPAAIHRTYPPFFIEIPPLSYFIDLKGRRIDNTLNLTTPWMNGYAIKNRTQVVDSTGNVLFSRPGAKLNLQKAFHNSLFSAITKHRNMKLWIALGRPYCLIVCSV